MSVPQNSFPIRVLSRSSRETFRPAKFLQPELCRIASVLARMSGLKPEDSKVFSPRMLVVVREQQRPQNRSANMTVGDDSSGCGLGGRQNFEREKP
jgi:hypothetical protein